MSNPYQNSAGTDGFAIITGEQSNNNDGVGGAQTPLPTRPAPIYTGQPPVGGVAKDPSGIPGPVGDKGPTGNQGPTGFQGLPGDKGIIGDQGPAGDPGPQGPIGFQGPVGDQGPIGPQGIIGDPGPVGDKGPVGDQGPIGPQGGLDNLTVTGNTITGIPNAKNESVIFAGPGSVKISNGNALGSRLTLGDYSNVDSGSFDSGSLAICFTDIRTGREGVGRGLFQWGRKLPGDFGYTGSSKRESFNLFPSMDADKSLSLQFIKDSITGREIVFTGAALTVDGVKFPDGTTLTSAAANLSDTAVAPGTYVNPTLTVDSKGRIVTAQNNLSPTFNDVVITGSISATAVTTSTMVVSTTLGVLGATTLSDVLTLPSRTRDELLVSLSSPAGTLAYCSNAPTGAAPAYFDGAVWVPMGAAGPAGPTGVGIASVTVNNEGALMVQYTDGTPPVSVGIVTGAAGAAGAAGADGISIQSATIDNTGSLMLLFSNDSQHNAGNLGLITNVTVDGNGDLIIHTSNDGTFNAGYVVGPQGIDGLTAYDLAVASGFVGTEAAWLASLVGPSGSAGTQGVQGIQGVQGPAGADGAQGVAGLGINLLGSVADVASLPAGAAQGDAYIVDADGNLHSWNGTVWVDVGQIVGPQGPQGVQGSAGVQGIQGIQGVAGNDGAQGIQGPSGLDGAPGAQGIQGIQGIQGVAGDAAWIPASTSLYVDADRVDTYTETGSILTPFKTIQAAINAASGTVDTAIVLGVHTYTENITINKNRLQFTGPIGATHTGSTTITAAAFLSRFIGITMNTNLTATIAGNCKIDLNECSVGAGTWNVTATEGAGAGYFQIWGGLFYPTAATISGFSNGLISVNGTNFSGAVTFDNSYVQISAAALWSSTFNLTGCTAYIGGSSTDGGATINMDSGTTLTTDAVLIDSTTINNVGGTLVNTTKKLDGVPAAAIGKAGDKVGMLAVDATYLYACTAAFDGTTSIWTRTPLATAW